MNKAKEYLDAFETNKGFRSNMITMNHKTLEDVKEVIENYDWSDCAPNTYNNILTEVEKIKL